MPGFELIGKEERAAVNQIFDDGGVLFAHAFDNLRNGRYRVREFEKAFAEHMGVSYAQAVSSGTAAIKVALIAMGVKPGDEVITQAFTFVATVEAIVDTGAKPVLVNIDETLNMDPNELEEAITPRTKVILPVHMLGVAAEMDPIIKIARRHNLSVLEDNCESLGASWNGKALGTQGDACAFSFDFGKTITTGEGGMVTTDNEEIYKITREYHDHGHENNPILPRGHDTRRIPGFNYRMTELQAAVGLVQLTKLDYIVERNHAIFAVPQEALSQIEGIKFRKVPLNCRPLCDCLVFELPSKDLANEFTKRMAQKNLATKNLPDALEWHFAGFWNHIFSAYGMSKKELWQHTSPSYERLARCIAIPIMVKHTPERAREIGEELKDIAKKLLSQAQYQGSNG